MQRTGEVVITMLPNVQQNTIAPLIKQTIAKGTVVYTDEYDIYGRLNRMGLPPPHRVFLGRGVRPRRGWGWILRSPCQHDRGLLVAVEVLAPITQRGLSAATKLEDWTDYAI